MQQSVETAAGTYSHIPWTPIDDKARFPSDVSRVSEQQPGAQIHLWAALIDLASRWNLRRPGVDMRGDSWADGNDSSRDLQQRSFILHLQPDRETIWRNCMKNKVI